MKHLDKLALASLMTITLSACNGDDGKDGATGTQGVQGAAGAQGETGQQGQNAPSSLKVNMVARAVLNAQSPEGAAEIVQYQKSTGWVYAINSSGDNATVDVLDLPNADSSALAADAEGVITNTNMATAHQINLTDNTPGDANSIAKIGRAHV